MTRLDTLQSGAPRSTRRTGWPTRRRTAHVPEVTHGLHISHDRTRNTVVVRASGVADLHTAALLATGLRTGYTPPPSLLVIDLTGLRFLSVTGLTVLAATQRRCREQQLTLRLVADHHSVLRCLKVTGMDVLFDIAPSLGAATRPATTWTRRLRPRRNRRSGQPPTPSRSQPAAPISTLV
jgi:anti-sigma B factor antagonist